MKNKFLQISLIFLISSLVISCDIKKSDTTPDAAFVKVYESTNIEESYFPLSIIETGNSGYLILSALDDSILTNYPRVHITSLAPDGNVLSSTILPEQYTNPVPNWIKINNKIYFICMDDVTLISKLIEVSVSESSINYSEIPLDTERKLPVYSWSNNTSFLLLCYNRLSRSSEIDLYDKNLNSVWSTSVNAVDDYESEIRSHLQKKGNSLPFFAGDIPNSGGSSDYFVNCLANYTVTTVFLSGNNGSAIGRLYAYQTGGAISSAIYINDSSFALARYHSGENYIYPLAVLDRNIIQNTKDFNDIPLTQLQSDAKTNLITYSRDDKDYILFASTTKSNQILLLSFDPETGNQVFTHTLGYGNPVEVVQTIQTNDNGLAVLGKTWINQRYQRVIFYKLSSDQISFD